MVVNHSVPAGCLNGGGQIKGNKDLVARVTEEYESLPLPDKDTRQRVDDTYRYIRITLRSRPWDNAWRLDVSVPLVL